jgi:hypothetical protein
MDHRTSAAHLLGLDGGLVAVPPWVVVALGAFVVAVVVLSLALLLKRRPPEEPRV